MALVGGKEQAIEDKRSRRSSSLRLINLAQGFKRLCLKRYLWTIENPIREIIQKWAIGRKACPAKWTVYPVTQYAPCVSPDPDGTTGIRRWG